MNSWIRHVAATVVAFLAVLGCAQARAGADETNRGADETSRLDSRLVRFAFSATEEANLFYQLHCMAELVDCSTAAYRDLWNRELGWTQDDEARLAEWRDSFASYQAEINFGEHVEPPLVYPLNHGPNWDLGDKLFVAGLASADAEDLAGRLTLLGARAQAQAWLGLLGHFAPRFHSWWEKTGREIATKQAVAMHDLTASAKVVEFSERVARFYGGSGIDQEPPETLTIHVLVRPLTPDERKASHYHTSATVLEGHAPVEVVEGERAADRLDVVFHELYHHFFWRRPLAAHVALLHVFANSSSTGALGLYSILDEAVATAIGNGLVGELLLGPAELKKRMDMPGGLYGEPFIDRVAKALVPLFQRELSSLSLGSADFANKYLAAATSAVGDGLDDPLLLLKSRAVVYFDASQKPAMRRLKNAFRATASNTQLGYAGSLLERCAKASGVVFVGPEHLEIIADRLGLGGSERATLRSLALGRDGFVYGVRRSPAADVYLLFGKSPAALDQSVTAFLAARHRFVGVLGTKSSAP